MAPLLAFSGFMGSGKTAVAREVARRLGRRFIDLDVEVESALGTPIAAYFSSHGEAGFRDRERETLQAVLDATREQSVILALGGGTLLWPENADAVCEVGKVVLLTVDVEEAWARVVGSNRPLAKDEEVFRSLWLERRAGYEGPADWIVPTGGRSVDQVASEVVSLVECGGPGSAQTWCRSLVGTERHSSVIGGEGALECLRARASESHERGSGFRVITDANVMGAWGDSVLSLLGGVNEADVCVLEPGESTKNAENLRACWEWLAERNTHRDDIVVALGGGVVGDLAGFVAATYHRGISLWQVPTSLLAQVDSSVGGKTAINLSIAKNLVGAFYQADLVIIDPATLGTLPKTEFVGALGEVVKHALLSGEGAVSSLECEASDILRRDEGVLSRLVKRNVWLKAAVVEEDERESGRRAILNLGHTTAHALEATLGYGSMTHGQAVALGILVALRISEDQLGLHPAVRARTESLLRALGLSTAVELPPTDAMVEATTHDKKMTAEASGFVGLQAIGSPSWGIQVAPEVFTQALEVIRR